MFLCSSNRFPFPVSSNSPVPGYMEIKNTTCKITNLIRKLFVRYPGNFNKLFHFVSKCFIHPPTCGFLCKSHKGKGFVSPPQPKSETVCKIIRNSMELFFVPAKSIFANFSLFLFTSHKHASGEIKRGQG